MRELLELYGWIMFVICGLIWLSRAIYIRDIIDLIVGVYWLVACSLFIIAWHTRK